MSTQALTKTELPQKAPETAARIRSGILRRKCECGGASSLTGGCDECKNKQGVLQRRGDGAVPSAVPAIVFDVLGTTGQPLDSSTRGFMESRFGHDFGRVRVHADTFAASSAGAVGALAYTVGNDVVFGPGQYAPQTGDGRKLLAHELAHVVQQQSPLVAAPQFDLEIGPAGDHFEQEADRLAEHVMRAPLLTTDKPRQPVPAKNTGRANNIDSQFHHDFSRVRVEAGAKSSPTALPRVAQGRPILRRKLIVEEDARANGPTLESTLTRLVGRPLVQSDQGVTLATEKPTGGSRVIESYIQRAIDSKQTYRLRWKAAVAAGQPQPAPPPAAPQPAPPAGGPQAVPQLGTIAAEKGEILITIDRSLLGERFLTADEIVTDQIVAAVVQFDPSTQIAPKPARTQAWDVPYPDVAEDTLLSQKLQGKDLQERQSRFEGFVSERFPQFSRMKQKFIALAGTKAKGVTLTEVIRGVETNTPFRISQEFEGNRVILTYLDPRLLPADADPKDFGQIFSNMERTVTFIPGASDATAPPRDLPLMNSPCSVAEQRDKKNSCCTPEMLEEFGRHLAKARTAVATTIQRLQGKERINCQVEDHFRDLDAAGINQVVEKLRLAEGELYLSRHGWQCRPRGSGFLFCDRDEWAPQDQVGGAVLRGNSTNVVICTDKNAPYSQWTTVLHEVMHRVGIHGEEIYRHQGGYPGKNPLDNADSYAWLVDNLGASDWEPCSPTVAGARILGGAGANSGVVMGARLEFTPSGPALHVVDFVLGVDFLWSPRLGVLGHGKDDPKTVMSRGYLGAEAGLRITIPRKHGSLMFDVAAGVGKSGLDEMTGLGATARIGAQWRFGKGPAGGEVGLDLMKLWTTSDDAKGDWVVAVSVGYRFGRAGARKSEGWQK
ncbi:MAG TPA: DUF4157 domain-containing protein [Pyrinomonadaceae bacterium]|nr:DUF4157 domain-containing protein [Pyrinomonadaceae bacterium]